MLTLFVILAWLGLFVMWFGVFGKHRHLWGFFYLGIGFLIPLITHLAQTPTFEAFNAPQLIGDSLVDGARPLICAIQSGAAICSANSASAVQQARDATTTALVPIFYLLLATGVVAYIFNRAPRK